MSLDYVDCMIFPPVVDDFVRNWARARYYRYRYIGYQPRRWGKPTTRYCCHNDPSLCCISCPAHSLKMQLLCLETVWKMGRKPPAGENWSNNCVVIIISLSSAGIRATSVTDYPIINNTQQRMRIFHALRERDKMTIELDERVVWVQRILGTTNSNTQYNKIDVAKPRHEVWDGGKRGAQNLQYWPWTYTT